MQFLVVIENGPNFYGAHFSSVPSCIVAGQTKETVVEMIREAIEYYFEGLRLDGLPIPAPTASSKLVKVEAA